MAFFWNFYVILTGIGFAPKTFIVYALCSVCNTHIFTHLCLINLCFFPVVIPHLLMLNVPLSLPPSSFTASFTHPTHLLACSLTHWLTHSPTHSLTHSLTHLLTHSQWLPHTHSLAHSHTFLFVWFVSSHLWQSKTLLWDKHDPQGLSVTEPFSHFANTVHVVQSHFFIGLV